MAACLRILKGGSAARAFCLRCALGFLLVPAGLSAAGTLGLLGEISLPVTARSRSGLFVVRGGAQNPNSSPLTALGGLSVPGQFSRIQASDSSEMVSLSPALVAVSGERVRAALSRILGLPEVHHGRIQVVIQSGYPGNVPLRIDSTPFADGWQYSITVPERIGWPRFVRAIAEAVLLDFSNPDPGRDLAPVPLWLSEGASLLLTISSGRELVPEPNREFKDPNRHFDPLPAVLQQMEGRSALDFASLSFPTEASLSEPSMFSLYQASAALFVHELPRAPGRPDSIHAFLRQLQNHLNWQAALLQAWNGRFQSLLEVEKWWAVQSSYRRIRNPFRLWSREATLGQLRSILTEAVVFNGTNAPVSTSTPAALRLSQVVSEWDYSAQSEVLERKITQLLNLFPMADPELLPQIKELHGYLTVYRTARTAPSAGRRGEPDPRARLLAMTASGSIRRVEDSIFGVP